MVESDPAFLVRTLSSIVCVLNLFCLIHLFGLSCKLAITEQTRNVRLKHNTRFVFFHPRVWELDHNDKFGNATRDLLLNLQDMRVSNKLDSLETQFYQTFISPMCTKWSYLQTSGKLRTGLYVDIACLALRNLFDRVLTRCFLTSQISFAQATD